MINLSSFGKSFNISTMWSICVVLSNSLMWSRCVETIRKCFEFGRQSLAEFKPRTILLDFPRKVTNEPPLRCSWTSSPIGNEDIIALTYIPLATCPKNETCGDDKQADAISFNASECGDLRSTSFKQIIDVFGFLIMDFNALVISHNPPWNRATLSWITRSILYLLAQRSKNSRIGESSKSETFF